MNILHFAFALVHCLIQVEGAWEEYETRRLINKDSEDSDKAYACVLELNRDLPTNNEPLFLRRTSGSLSLLLPKMKGKRSVIALEKGEKIVISCPGKRNYIEVIETVQCEGSCNSGTRLNIHGSNYKTSDLDCYYRVSAATKPLRTKCARGKGIIVELGFDVGSWISLLESCHDVAKSLTYYSKHIIHGAIIGDKIRRKTGRPNFSKGNDMFFSGFSPQNSYTKRNQKSVFAEILGTQYARNYLGSSRNFLARGHLAPDADFIFSAHQFSTYFYVNAAPQWQSINAGNWLRVEENTRKIANYLGIDLEVMTGTEGVLTLEGSNGQKEIWLEYARLPVPKHFWKVIRNPEDESCIAFVSTNNPFLNRKPNTICQDECAKNGWPLLQNDMYKGYVYCCRYQNIKKAIPEIPNLTCMSVLQWIS